MATCTFDTEGVGDAWHIGDGPIRVFTVTGAEYCIDEDGWVAGGTRILRGQRRNKLLGSVRHERGQLHLGIVAPGLCLEIHRPSRSMFTSAVVTRWEPEVD